MKNLIQKALIGMMAVCICTSVVPTNMVQAKEPNFITITEKTLQDNDVKYVDPSNKAHEDLFLAEFATNTKHPLVGTDGDSIKVISSDESIVSMEPEVKDDEIIYHAVCKKAGIAHVKIVPKDPEIESMCIKIHVIDRVAATKKKIDLKKGDTTTTAVTVWSKNSKLTVKSDNNKVATAKLSNPDAIGHKRKLTISGKSAGSAKITVQTEDGKYKTTINVNVAKKIDYTPVEDVTGDRRAIVIGQEYCCMNQLISCPKDALAMEKMCKQTGYTSVNKLIDASRDTIKKSIMDAAKEATKDDVTLFYYSGHGDSNGGLVAFDKENHCNIDVISPKLLASWLNQVPGKVIVIMDSCFSGNVIGKGLNTSSNASEADVAQAFVNAFAQQENVTAKGGALSGKKFKVLAACTKDEYSSCDAEKGFFTEALIKGCGFTLKSGKQKTDAPADLNKDNKLTLEECQNYTAQFARNARQHSVCYPSKSGFKLFERK